MGLLDERRDEEVFLSQVGHCLGIAFHPMDEWLLFARSGRPSSESFDAFRNGGREQTSLSVLGHPVEKKLQVRCK